jgi:hypothetical protein
VLYLLAVGFGPVEIGGKTYTCPVRSVSIMGATRWMPVIYPFGESALREVTLLNEDDFRELSSVPV